MRSWFEEVQLRSCSGVRDGLVKPTPPFVTAQAIYSLVPHSGGMLYRLMGICKWIAVGLLFGWRAQLDESLKSFKLAHTDKILTLDPDVASSLSHSAS
jgi:hypothetical protein